MGHFPTLAQKGLASFPFISHWPYQSHGQSHCRGRWEIQRSSQILISIEVTATVIICLIFFFFFLPHLTVEETEAQRNGDMAQDLAASVGGRPIQVQVYLPARPPSQPLPAHSPQRTKAWDPVEWQEGSHPGMDTSSGQSPQWINPPTRTSGAGQVRPTIFPYLYSVGLFISI